MRGLLQRSIRPPDETPNDNDPASVPPATVGPPSVNPGDPHGVLFEGPAAPSLPPPSIVASAWSGWPADWFPPNWSSRVNDLAGTAWTCVDLNASILAEMAPYLVNGAPTIDAGWLANPDPDLYSSWDEFAKQLFWDYQLGEAFVIATAFYATGWPARFHVVPPWFVNVEMAGGSRRYSIGSTRLAPNEILHLRYASTIDDARGHGPLEAGRTRVVAAELLARYASGIAQAGGIPSSVLRHPEELSPEQAAELKAQWVLARQSGLGEPAVLSGGVTWEATQLNPRDMALVDLQQFNESRVAVMLGVPPFLVGLPSGGDSMTYSNVSAIFDYHWRAGLRPKAHAVMAGLSEWLLPRGTQVEVNQDSYVQPEPLERAQIAQILNSIRDDQGQPVLSVEQIQEAERLTNATPQSGGPIG